MSFKVTDTQVFFKPKSKCLCTSLLNTEATLHLQIGIGHYFKGWDSVGIFTNKVKAD